MTSPHSSAAVPNTLAAQLAAVGQSHVLDWWGRLDAAGRSLLVGQLALVDWNQFATLQRLAAAFGAAAAPPAIDIGRTVTPPCLRLGDAENPIQPTAARIRGEEALSAGQVGAILVAGGQGTRLGCTGPKGLYRVGPVSQARLFELLFGKLLAVRRRFGRDVPLAIMTSSATDADTRQYLRDHAWCGLSPDHVHVFRQHDLPALCAATGRLLLDGPDHVAMAPDGHGGMLMSLAETGGLDWFERHGAQTIVSFQVDNPLALPLDREFLGYHLLSAAEFSTQVVRKREPAERVGVVVEEGGRYGVVEYSDLPPALAAERLPDGRLRFDAGSIAIHAFSKSFLDRAASRNDSLPLHLAHKVVPFIDEHGMRVTPPAPNAIKFERFIFDLMPLATKVCLIEVDPAEGFAPLKNPPGAAADAPEHVRAALVAHARRLLERSGARVADGIDVELDAVAILDEADIAREIPPGTRIERPLVVGSSRESTLPRR
jgi:UDP-N-acetylglucosamine/UDP-N-acetylgalactosamine diphosphorylase